MQGQHVKGLEAVSDLARHGYELAPHVSRDGDLGLVCTLGLPRLYALLHTLEEQGLIRRQARTGDMRVREIYITEDGRSRFGEVWRPMYDMYTHLFDGIDETELRSFVGTLHKVLDNIRSNDF